MRLFFVLCLSLILYKNNTVLTYRQIIVLLQDFPADIFLETPAAAPGLGVLGYSFFGENINGPLDGGFEPDRV